MRWFYGLPKWLQWSTIVSTLGFLVLVSNAIKASSTIEPYMPAHRGYVRGVNSDTTDKYAQQLVLAQTMTSNKYDDLANLITAEHISRIKDSLPELEFRIFMLEERLEANPRDEEIRRLLSSLKRDLMERENRIRIAECDLLKKQFPGASC